MRGDLYNYARIAVCLVDFTSKEQSPITNLHDLAIHIDENTMICLCSVSEVMVCGVAFFSDPGVPKREVPTCPRA